MPYLQIVPYLINIYSTSVGNIQCTQVCLLFDTFLCIHSDIFIETERKPFRVFSSLIIALNNAKYKIVRGYFSPHH